MEKKEQNAIDAWYNALKEMSAESKETLVILKESLKQIEYDPKHTNKPHKTIY